MKKLRLGILGSGRIVQEFLPWLAPSPSIEAAALCSTERSAAAAADPPQVTLRIRRLGDEYVVSVRNRVSQDIPLRQDELPASTKGEPGHGMGLANVRAVVERCGGEYAITCKDKWFCFTCSIPCEG